MKGYITKASKPRGPQPNYALATGPRDNVTLAFPLFTEAGAWWVGLDRATLNARRAELDKWRHWGKSADSTFGSGVA